MITDEIEEETEETDKEDKKRIEYEDNIYWLDHYSYHDSITKDNCKIIIKKNSINITLVKKDSKTWDNLYFKETLVKI